MSLGALLLLEPLRVEWIDQEITLRCLRLGGTFRYGIESPGLGCAASSARP